DFEHMLDTLAFINIHIHEVVISRVAIAREGQLQIAFSVKRLETRDQLVRRDFLVEREVRGVKVAGIGSLFYKGAISLGETTILVDFDQTLDMVEAGPIVCQCRMGRLEEQIQQASL